ncbi:LPXTG cell wall anchor domain-containing protein [Streptococcus suis]|nr:LPXTG cell wall anchor domain-containing protein [Streptococcus suis]
MKIKRSSSKKQLHKWTKLGVGFLAVSILGGGTTPAGIDLFHVDTVYAQAQESVTAVLTFYDVSDLSEIADRVYIDVKPGESISYTFPVFDGYILHEDYDSVLVLDYDDVVGMNGRTYATGFRKVEKPAGDTNSTDTNTVNYTIQLVDQDGQVLQTIQQSGVEGTEVSFEVPVISGYREGKTEGFDSWTYGKGGTFRLVANKTVKVYYDKAPSIDSLIRPEQRVEYQKVFDEFHTTILKAFEVYKRELGVDDITYEANDLEKIFADSNLSVLHSELVLVQPLFAKPVGLVLTDQDIINAIGWTPEYWDHQIAYHKEIIQKLEKALANIAASKAIPTVPVDQSITIKAVYTEEQIEPGQKVDVLKEIEYTLKPGESVVLEPLTFEGWTSRVVQESQTVTYEEAKARPNKEYYFYYIEEGTTPTDKQVEQPVEAPTEKPAEQLVEKPTEKPIETPAEAPTEKPAEQLVETPTEQPVETPTASPTAKPTEQSASEKQATKQGDKEPAAPASQSKQATVKPASTSQSQAKSLPATGEVSSVLHLTGLGLLGLAGLVVKRRPRKSS